MKIGLFGWKSASHASVLVKETVPCLPRSRGTSRVSYVEYILRVSKEGLKWKRGNISSTLSSAEVNFPSSRQTLPQREVFDSKRIAQRADLAPSHLDAYAPTLNKKTGRAWRASAAHDHSRIFLVPSDAVLSHVTVRGEEKGVKIAPLKLIDLGAAGSHVKMEMASKADISKASRAKRECQRMQGLIETLETVPGGSEVIVMETARHLVVIDLLRLGGVCLKRLPMYARYDLLCDVATLPSLFRANVETISPYLVSPSADLLTDPAHSGVMIEAVAKQASLTNNNVMSLSLGNCFDDFDTSVRYTLIDPWDYFQFRVLAQSKGTTAEPYRYSLGLQVQQTEIEPWEEIEVGSWLSTNPSVELDALVRGRIFLQESEMFPSFLAQLNDSHILGELSDTQEQTSASSGWSERWGAALDLGGTKKPK